MRPATRHADLTIWSVAYASEAAQELVAAMLADLRRRDGQESFAPLDPAVFTPPQGEFVVAMSGTEAVGCGAYMCIDHGLAELKRMFVQPSWRRRGVGHLLLRDLEERAWASGYGAMRLETGRSQPEAMRLYARCGYRVIPRFPPHCDDTLSVCMAKELAPFA